MCLVAHFQKNNRGGMQFNLTLNADANKAQHKAVNTR